MAQTRTARHQAPTSARAARSPSPRSLRKFVDPETGKTIGQMLDEIRERGDALAARVKRLRDSLT